MIVIIDVKKIKSIIPRSESSRAEPSHEKRRWGREKGRGGHHVGKMRILSDVRWADTWRSTCRYFLREIWHVVPRLSLVDQTPTLSQSLDTLHSHLHLFTALPSKFTKLTLAIIGPFLNITWKASPHPHPHPHPPWFPFHKIS